MAEPCDFDALEARRLIGRGALSPVELLESCIGRIEKLDGAVNAVVTRDFERARVQARAAAEAVRRGDELGPLHGLPVGIKDLEEVAGLRTTWGSPIWTNHVPARDQGIVARVRAAGGIVAGKTNTAEWGAGANTRNAVFGATGNPFDPARSVAGSSGGSAAALACGMLPLATGSDMGGSLRNPAAFCGVVGFRPSPGLVPNERRGLGWSALSVLGPMARTVADVALLLSAIAGDDASDPLADAIPERCPRRARRFNPLAPCDLSRLRVAFTPDFGFAPTEAHIRRVFAARVAEMSGLFASLDEASPDCAGTDETFEVLRGVGFLAAHFDDYRQRPDLLGPNVRANVEQALGYSGTDIARASVRQTMLYRNWQRFFERYDLLLSPAITISPRPWRELYPTAIDGKSTRTYFHWLALAYAASLVGHPALSLPVGRDEAGMPFGMQIVGPRGGDAPTLRAALALEAALAGSAAAARPLPDLEALAGAPPMASRPGFLGFD